MYSLIKSSRGNFLLNPAPSGLNLGVAGRKVNNFDYSDKENVRFEEKSLLKELTGIDRSSILMLEQVHGDSIIHVVAKPSEDRPAVAEADGFITAIPDICLVIRTADCVPVFIYDHKEKILGAVHSGWKGTYLNISGRCVRDMIEYYGCNPENISAFILPSIGPQSYEVKEDVASKFPEDFIEFNGRLFLNLWQSIERSLKREGITNIFNCYMCNKMLSHEFFSHRNGDLGRNLNYAFIS
jgi:hypothetical protein